VPVLLQHAGEAAAGGVLLWHRCAENDAVQEEEAPEESRVHVLAPFTKNVNSIKRHVRTRIYFTSESHIHALMNILRYSEMDGQSLLSEEARERLDNTAEFDYLTQIVFRLYEQNLVRANSPDSCHLLVKPGLGDSPSRRIPIETPSAHNTAR
jgi:hypothetical protein